MGSVILVRKAATQTRSRIMDIEPVPDWRLHAAAEVGLMTPHSSIGAQPGDILVVLTTTKVRDLA